MLPGAACPYGYKGLVSTIVCYGSYGPLSVDKLIGHNVENKEA
jgi:hypothetical protein